MATVYSEADRVLIRHFLGASATFLQAIPIIENAIGATQAVSDPPGTRPDDSTVKFILGLIYGTVADLTDPLRPKPATRGLLTIEQLIGGTWDVAEALGVDEIKVDPARGAAMLRREGRRLVHSLARMLGMKGPLADVFGSAAGLSSGDTDAVRGEPNFRG